MKIEAVFVLSFTTYHFVDHLLKILKQIFGGLASFCLTLCSNN
jgi:hypothetical protein